MPYKVGVSHTYKKELQAGSLWADLQTYIEVLKLDSPPADFIDEPLEPTADKYDGVHALMSFGSNLVVLYQYEVVDDNDVTSEVVKIILAVYQA